MATHRMAQFATSLVVLISLAGTATAVAAGTPSTAVPAASVGYDISFPQCGGNLPTGIGFGVVGVNDGRPLTVNPCLATEIQWAASGLGTTPQFYVNTANPGPSNNPAWPTTQTFPQVCTGADSVACSYDYGWNAGSGSLTAVIAAETKIGATSPASAATTAPWWLDVETGNSWQSMYTGAAPTPAQFANDQAMIQGELDFLAGHGIHTLGIYSTSYQWGEIAGPSGKTFAAYDAWLPGYASLADAQVACSYPAFTGGRTAMIQYSSNALDGDYVCPLIATPSAASVMVASSATFTDQLAVAGEQAPVAFVQSAGSPTLLVSPTGLVTTSGQLARGTYTATGTMSTNGITGSFSFTLSVGELTQVAPTTNTTSVTASTTFTDQLSVTAVGGAVTYAQTSGSPALVVSPTGLVSTSGQLARGTYVARGTTSDPSGDGGTFFYRLTVGTLTSNPPVRASVTTFAATSYTDQLSVSGATGTVTFTQTTGSPSLVVSPTGLLSTSGSLAVGSYVARGTTSDSSGDGGTFFFNLLVTPVGTLTQTSPTSATVTSAVVGTFSDQLNVTGATGPMTYASTSASAGLAVSSTGLVTPTSSLAVGTYSVAGTTTDAEGDVGTFSFTLTVAAPATIAQAAPTAASVNTLASNVYTDQLAVSGANGRVTFTQSSGAPAIVVSSSGAVSTSGPLKPGTYTAAGTTADAAGDAGTFTYALTVTPPPTMATRVVGHAVAGHTVTLQILGLSLVGRPTVRSHAGTKALVTRDTGTALTVRVTVAPRSRNGIFVFTITFANGAVSRVRYVQR